MTRPEADAINRARTLVADAREARHQAMAALLRPHGFAESADQLVQHPVTGVTLATTTRAYRITFYSPHVSIGLLDIPADIAFRLVAQVALAMHNDVAARH